VRDLGPLSANFSQGASPNVVAAGGLRGTNALASERSSSGTSAFRVCNAATTSQKLTVKVRLNGKELTDSAGMEPLHCKEFEETVSLDDDIEVQLGQQKTQLKPDPDQLYGSPALFLVAFVDGELPNAEYCIREFYGRRQKEPCEKGIVCNEDAAHVAFLDVLRSPESDAATAGMRLNKPGLAYDFSDSQATHVPAGKYSVQFTGPEKRSRSRSTNVKFQAKRGSSYVVLRVRTDERPWSEGKPGHNETVGRDQSGDVLSTPEESVIVFPDDTPPPSPPMVPKSWAHLVSPCGLTTLVLFLLGSAL